MSNSVQQSLPLMGDVKRPMHQHPAKELAACRTKQDACRVALLHSGFTQETMAMRLAVSEGYMSMLLNGKRRWTDDLQFKFEQITGSLAPAQWDAQRRGLSLYLDEVEVRRAQLLAELGELDKAA